MIIEKLSFANADLVAGSAVKTIAVVSIAKTDAEALTKIYKPIRIHCVNNTNVTVNFIAFDDSEYAAYVAAPLTFDKAAILTTGTFTYVPISGRVTKLVIASAAFAGTFDVEIWKE